MLVESFLIKSASGAGSLEFLDRRPLDLNLPIEEFRVSVSDVNLSASTLVYADSAQAGLGNTALHPAGLFREMAERWRGWSGEWNWGSLDDEIRLRCTQDRTGHVSIFIELRAGPMEWDWSTKATVMVEAGHLEGIARRAESFFGKP